MAGDASAREIKRCSAERLACRSSSSRSPSRFCSAATSLSSGPEAISYPNAAIVLIIIVQVVLNVKYYFLLKKDLTIDEKCASDVWIKAWDVIKSLMRLS